MLMMKGERSTLTNGRWSGPLFRPLVREASATTGHPGASLLRLATALLAILPWFGPLPLSAASFTATLDRETVAVGESATLSLSFEGGEPKSIPVPPAIPNLQITDQGNSRNISIVNGQMTSSISQRFALTPTQPGNYTIPALKAEVNGQIQTSQPLKLTAVKPAASVGGNDGEPLAFLKLFVPKKEVFVGEVLSVELQVYIRDGVANAERLLQNLDEFGGSPLKAEGFSVLKTAHAQRRRARAGNATYSVATLVTALMPVKTGPLTISSIDITLPLQIPQPNQRRRDPFFDPFGMFPQVEERRVALAADTETLTALALPKENVPTNFNGAVGNFSLSLTAGPTNVAMGDPVTVRIQISGRGALDSLSLPEQSAWRDFKTYPPTAKVETTDGLGLQGTKTFEQVVVPQKDEIKALPPASFSFFDPDQKSYRVLTQPSVPLVVRPSGSMPAPAMAAAGRGGQDNAPPEQDIVDIKQRLGTMAQITPPLVQQRWFLALQGLPVLAWISALVWRKRADQLANNPRLRRQRYVTHLVHEGLDELRRLAQQNKSDEFFATLFRLLQEQLGERLDLPASAITEAVIEERLRPRAVPETILGPLHELFHTCNFARYAPIRTSQELAAVIPKFEAVVGLLQGLKQFSKAEKLKS